MTEASSSELEQQLGELMKKHQDLGVKLTGLENDRLADHLEIQEIKKQKLMVKDSINLVQQKLHS